MRLGASSCPPALAVYNAGEEAGEWAIAVAGTSEIGVLISRRLLPAETRNYVAAGLATMSLFRNEGFTELRELARQPGRTFQTLFCASSNKRRLSDTNHKEAA